MRRVGARLARTRPEVDSHPAGLDEADAALEWNPIREVPPLFATAVAECQRALSRWIAWHRLVDLDELATTWGEIVESTDFADTPVPFQVDLLNRSAVALQWQALATRKAALLEPAVQRLTLALELAPQGEPSRGRSLTNLSSVLLLRFDIAGAIDDFDAALDSALAAVGEAGDDPATIAIARSNAASALSVRYTTRGDPADLRHAVELADAAVSAAEAFGSTRLPRYRGVLATVLGRRFDALGEIDDLDRGIEVLARPVELDPLREARNVEAQLGSMLRRRWFVARDPVDLERAVTLLDGVVRSAGDQVSPALLTNLGNALVDRYHERGDVDDLRRAFEMQERAVELTRADDWQLASRHNNAGNAALAMYEVSRDRDAAAGAVEHYRRSIALTNRDAPELASRQYNLGNALRAVSDASGQETHAIEARAAFREACENGLQAGLQWALASARVWGGWAGERDEWAEAAAAYGYGLQAIDDLVRRQLERDEKVTWLEQARGLSAEAGYALARVGRLVDGALAMERGRAFLLSEVLERSRVELEDLERLGRVDLAARYREASEQLRLVSTAGGAERRLDA